MSQNDFVEVDVNLALAGAPTANYGTGNLLHSLTDAQDALFGTSRYKLMTAETWQADLAAIGVSAGEAVYADSSAYFGQDYTPAKGYVGRRGKAIAQVTTVVVPGTPADGTYVIHVPGAASSPYSFAAVGSTQGAVRTALISALGAGSATFTAAAGVGPGDIKLTAVALGTPLNVSVQSPASSMTSSVTTGTKVAAVAQVWTLDINSAALGPYVLTVQTTTGQEVYTHIATSGATVTTIRDALKALYDADPSDLFGATMTSVSTDQGTLTASIAGRPGTVSITSPASDATVAITTANYGIADDIAALRSNLDWYYLIPGTHSAVELQLAAQYIETTQSASDKRQCIIQTSDANNLTDASGNILGKIKDLGLKRTGGVYHPLDAEGVHAAWVGRVGSIPVGQVTWQARALNGLTGNILDATSEASIQSNEGSFLERFEARSQNIMNGGYSFFGRPLDIIRGMDTFEFNLKTANMDYLVNNNIVPYTNTGFEAVRGVTITTFNQAVEAGYAVDGTLVLSKPKTTDATSDERARGIMPVLVGEFQLQAGVHKIQARFTVYQ